MSIRWTLLLSKEIQNNNLSEFKISGIILTRFEEINGGFFNTTCFERVRKMIVKNIVCYSWCCFTLQMSPDEIDKLKADPHYSLVFRIVIARSGLYDGDLLQPPTKFSGEIAKCSIVKFRLFTFECFRTRFTTHFWTINRHFMEKHRVFISIDFHATPTVYTFNRYFKATSVFSSLSPVYASQFVFFKTITN